MSANSEWDGVLAAIEAKVGLDVRRAWFDYLRPSGVDRHGVLRIGAPTAFWAHWMRTNFERQTLAAAKTQWPKLVRVTFHAYGRPDESPTSLSNAPSLLTGLTPRSRDMSGDTAS